jgi:hypothetical protein
VQRAAILEYFKEKYQQPNAAQIPAPTPESTVSTQEEVGQPCVLKSPEHQVYLNEQLKNACPTNIRGATNCDWNNIYMLINNGADVNTKLSDGTTLLIQAVKEGRTNAVTFCLRKNADPNIQDDEGKVALHYAAIGLNPQYVSQLKNDAQAKLDIKDKQGRTPLDLAVAQIKKEAYTPIKNLNSLDPMLEEQNAFSLRYLINHNRLLNNIAYAKAAGVTPQQFAKLTDFERVVVGNEKNRFDALKERGRGIDMRGFADQLKDHETLFPHNSSSRCIYEELRQRFNYFEETENLLAEDCSAKLDAMLEKEIPVIYQKCDPTKK